MAMKASYFGTTQPYIQRVDNAAIAFNLLHSNVTKCEPVSRDVIHESELSAERVAIDRGGFYEVEIMIYIFKSATDKTDYNTLFDSFYKKEVYFKLHADADFVKVRGTTDNAKFYVTDLIPQPLQALDTRDTIILRLISLNECKILTV